MSKIFLYPEIHESTVIYDIIGRLSWYFKPYMNQIEAIKFIGDRQILDSGQLPPVFDPRIAEDLPWIKAKIQILDFSGFAEAIERVDLARDILFIWDQPAEKDAPAPIKTAIRALSLNQGFYRVDPRRTRMEGSFYLWAGVNRYADQAALVVQSRGRLRKMLAEIGRHEKAYVFGSGPSLSKFVGSHDFSDGVCIISNSIVKNRDILATTRPRVITAADPLYHAGCSSYAAAFRFELIVALRETGAWFVCPMRDFAIYDTVLPEDLRPRLIGIPFDKSAAPPTNLDETFHFRPYPNILTLALLPLASTLADRVEIVGCDGRSLTDDSFFWSHDKKAQFNDKMADIQAAHPAFFAIDYNDYYTEHCRDVEEVLSTMETAAKVIVTATPSMIPALRARERVASTPVQSRVPARALVMIDPDAKDDWGHFLAYDKRLAEGCHDLSTDFVLICRKDLESSFFPVSANLVFPTLSVNSWTLGNKWPNCKLSDRMLFAKEIESAFDVLEKRISDGVLCVFMYVGSLEVAEILEHLLMSRPRFRAVVNLFWSYNFDHNDLAYRRDWQNTVRRMLRTPQLKLMHSTPQIATEFHVDWDVSLPILPHPSTTFADKIAQELNNQPPANPTSPLRVLFPGGTRKEKGFLLSVDACALLVGDSNLRIALRARIDHVSGRALESALEGLVATAGTDVEVLDGDLSDPEFVQMICTADIVVIPYQAEAFRRRTSGILVDAFLLGKPVVVLKNTWLADIVEAGKMGLCTDPDPAEIAAAVRQVAARYNDFLPGVARVREEYLQRHSWKALVAKVLDIAGLDLPVTPMQKAFQSGCSVAGRTRVEVNTNAEASRPIPSRIGMELHNAVEGLPAKLLLLKMTTDLLLDASATLRRIETETELRDRIDGVLADTNTDAPLRNHYIRCHAHALNSHKQPDDEARSDR